MNTTCTDCGKSWTGHRPEHCTMCHETFGGTDAGDRHRIGSYSDPGDPHRCANPAERGMTLSRRGIWVTAHSGDREDHLSAVA